AARRRYGQTFRAQAFQVQLDGFANHGLAFRAGSTATHAARKIRHVRRPRVMPFFVWPVLVDHRVRHGFKPWPFSEYYSAFRASGRIAETVQVRATKHSAARSEAARSTSDELNTATGEPSGRSRNFCWIFPASAMRSSVFTETPIRCAACSLVGQSGYFMA